MNSILSLYRSSSFARSHSLSIQSHLSLFSPLTHIPAQDKVVRLNDLPPRGTILRGRNVNFVPSSLVESIRLLISAETSQHDLLHPHPSRHGVSNIHEVRPEAYLPQ